MRRRLKISVGDEKTIVTCLIKSDKFALFKKVQFQVPKMQILALEWTNSFSMSRSNKLRSYFALNNQRVSQVSNSKTLFFIKKEVFFYLNMKPNFPSRWAITAFSEKMSVSVRFFGFEILMKIQPTRTASTSVPRRHCSLVRTCFFCWKLYARV